MASPTTILISRSASAGPGSNRPLQTLGRILRGGLNAWIALLEALGARGTRWQWKKQAWRQALEDRIVDLEGRGARSAPYARICTACRALGRPGDTACPICGAPLAVRLASRPGGLLAFLPAHSRATAILITVNIGLLVVILATRGIGETRGLFGFLSPSPRALVDFGARYTPLIEYGQTWRLITAMYLHGGILHLLFNCMALHSLGTLIEEAFGARKLFAIYTITGVAGFAASTYVGGHPLSVGASGAIFGLLGFAFVFGRYRGGSAGRAVADHLKTWILYGAVMLFFPGFDNWAHAGGFGAGALLGLLVTPGEPRTPWGERALKALSVVLVLVTIASFAAMVAAQIAARAD